MNRSRTISSLAGCAVSVLFSCLASSCGEAPGPTDGQVEGAALATALSTSVQQSAQWAAPYRCARFPWKTDAPNLDRVQWDETAQALVLEPLGKHARFATISDALAVPGSNTDALERLRKTLDENKIDLLVSLGGIGTEQSAIGPVLKALTDDANYLVLALPGDRESIPAHRRAIAELARAGARILDASLYRTTRIGRLRLVTMPGISHGANLIPGNDGCLHVKADVDAILEQVEKSEAPTVLLSYAPWRQAGEDSSDFGLGAIHAGERLLEPLYSSGRFEALVHGMLTTQESAPSGSFRLMHPPSAISSGSVAKHASSPSALLLSVTGAKLSWKRLPVQ